MTEYIAWCQAFRVTNTRIKKPSSCNILLLLMRHTMHTFNAYEYVLPDRGNMKIMSMQNKKKSSVPPIPTFPPSRLPQGEWPSKSLKEYTGKTPRRKAV